MNDIKNRDQDKDKQSFNAGVIDMEKNYETSLTEQDQKQESDKNVGQPQIPRKVDKTRKLYHDNVTRLRTKQSKPI